MTKCIPPQYPISIVLGSLGNSTTTFKVQQCGSTASNCCRIKEGGFDDSTYIVLAMMDDKVNPTEEPTEEKAASGGAAVDQSHSGPDANQVEEGRADQRLYDPASQPPGGYPPPYGQNQYMNPSYYPPSFYRPYAYPFPVPVPMLNPFQMASPYMQPQPPGGVFPMMPGWPQPLEMGGSQQQQQQYLKQQPASPTPGSSPQPAQDKNNDGKQEKAESSAVSVTRDPNKPRVGRPPKGAMKELPPKCSDKECTARACCGFTGHQPTVCRKHSSTGMVQLCKALCEELGCLNTPKYSHLGDKPRFCKNHSESGMVHSISKKCAFAGCTKSPSYAVLGERPKFCLTHKQDGMVNVKKRLCLEDDCNKQPSYGFKDGKGRPLYCQGHSKPGMITLMNKLCENEDCMKHPTYGTERGKPRFCKGHSAPGMFDVKRKLCEQEGCRSIPLFGAPGERPSHCRQHSNETMVCSQSRKKKKTDDGTKDDEAFIGGTHNDTKSVQSVIKALLKKETEDFLREEKEKREKQIMESDNKEEKGKEFSL